jgi:plastocyanin
MRTQVLAVAALLAFSASALANDVTVRQKNKTFSTQTVQVKAGGSVVFANDDTVTHNVYSITKGLEFEIKTQEPGKADTVRFDKAGVVLVECAIHPKMKLNVHVQQ